jgi:RNase P protein component
LLKFTIDLKGFGIIVKMCKEPPSIAFQKVGKVCVIGQLNREDTDRNSGSQGDLTFPASASRNVQEKIGTASGKSQNRQLVRRPIRSYLRQNAKARAPPDAFVHGQLLSASCNAGK